VREGLDGGKGVSDQYILDCLYDTDYDYDDSINWILKHHDVYNKKKLKDSKAKAKTSTVNQTKPNSSSNNTKGKVKKNSNLKEDNNLNDNSTKNATKIDELKLPNELVAVSKIMKD